MTIHLRLDELSPGHKMFTLFLNGINTGRLTMTHRECTEFITLISDACKDPCHQMLLSGEWN